MPGKRSNGLLSRHREGRRVDPFWKTGGRNTRTLFMPAIEAHGVLTKELEARKLELDPAEVAAVEVAALVNTLKAYRAGIVQILARRYVKDRSYWQPFVTVKYPKGRRALYTTKKYGTAYKNIVGGRVRVKGPKKVNIVEWNPVRGKKDSSSVCCDKDLRRKSERRFSVPVSAARCLPTGARASFTSTKRVGYASISPP